MRESEPAERAEQRQIRRRGLPQLANATAHIQNASGARITTTHVRDHFVCLRGAILSLTSDVQVVEDGGSVDLIGRSQFPRSIP